MPELPEVEHAARCLSRWLQGRRVEAVRAAPTRVLRGSAGPVRLSRALLGRRFVSVERRGKVLLLSFDGDVGLLSHLGMTGKWQRCEGPSPLAPHERLRLALDDGRAVIYRDPRMFGRIALHPARALPSQPEVTRLGPDPLRDGLSARALGAALARTRRAVKVALLDPSLVAGLGNIQAQEALFRARIDPRRLATTLTARELTALTRGIHASIRHTLAALGGDEITYVEEGGENPFLVYARAGEPCPRCAASLQRIVQAARSTVLCARCQR